jgi:hypothetical protein
MPLLHNYQCRGKTWSEHAVKKEAVIEVNRKIGEASHTLWEYAKILIDKACEEGFLASE